jgi:hypothetical protein
MKKRMMVALFSVVVVFIACISAQAQVPKEGTVSGVRAFSTTSIKTVAMGKERVMLIYEATGVHIGDSSDSILHNSSFRGVGSTTIVKGTLEDSGFCVNIRPDGDQIFTTYKSIGVMATGIKRTWTFVGGTGKFVGIEGGGENEAPLGIRPAAEGSMQGYNRMTGHYKLP